ncbi:hypothetical protein SAY86_019676 [Trapa natans]|uniref:PB1 domain-containing protein n=1 Tax=Trapa natans TaxID=22666 RepID=A0AAN7R3H0_TRANT|nr:hypothetical protein SAY86_019676 [Trapa natans]
MEPSLPAAASPSKLRLMCSYGGHIVPRPHKKSLLFYSGGETRIVSIPATAAATLSTFTAAVSAALSVPAPFTIKYQLPGHDLDSLISLFSDDDLLVLLDELPHLPPPSRIRLFLFPWMPAPPGPAVPELRHSVLPRSVLCHPKTEAWFIDALNSARMMQKGESPNESLSNGGAISGAESIVLETNSSFGSTSSSVSLTNLPSGKSQEGDNLQESLAKLPLSDPPQSDTRGINAAPVVRAGIHYEQVAGGAAPSAALEPQNISILGPSLPPYHQTVRFPVQPLHHLIPAGPMYAPQQQQPIRLLPMSSTQPVYQLQPPLYRPTNPPYPFYIMPSNPNLPQSYGMGMSGHCGLAAPTGHLYPAVSPVLSSQEVNYASNPGPPCKTDAQQFASTHQLQQNVQPVEFDQREETSSPRDEFDGDPAHVQIYKSQPPLPTLPSQYQTMTNAATLM